MTESLESWMKAGKYLPDVLRGWGSGASGLEHLEALRADADVAQRLAVAGPLNDHAKAVAAGQFA